MKLFAVVAFASMLSIANAQPGTEQSAGANPEGQGAYGRPQTISADLLRQPLCSNAKRILGQARHAADAGDHFRAIELLKTAHAKYPESDGWTQSLLGVEYLTTGQYTSALSSLERAVVLLPHDPGDRSNLALALVAIGHYERAELEVRCALALNHGELKTRQLFAIVLAAETDKPSTGSQSVTASNDPCAH